MTQPMMPGSQPGGDDTQIPVNVQDIIDEAAKIEGQIVGDLTKDLAAQRAISNAMKNRILELQNECDMRDQLVRELQEHIENLENPPSPPISDEEQAQKVLDKIIEGEPVTNGNGNGSVGDKTKAKEVVSASVGPASRPPRPRSQ